MTQSAFFKICTLLLLLNITELSRAGVIIIKGSNPDYKGQKLELLAYKNQITNNEQKIASSTVDSLGNFEWKFTSDKMEYVFLHLGVFYTYMFTEPNNTYEIKLPPYTPRKQDEKLNPFFNESYLHLLILSVNNKSSLKEFETDQELNFLTNSFDEQYDTLFTKYAIKTYSQQDTHNLDSTIDVLNSKYGNIPNSYFHEYYYYRIGLLKFSTARLKSKIISNTWFLNKPVLYYNPAYMELFNQVYDKYFVYFGRTKNGKQIYSDINSNGSLYGVKQTLAQDNILQNDTLKELVILKGIHDGFYEMEFSRNGLLKILDSLILTTKIESHREIGKDIRVKVTKLLVGYSPPDFNLYDKSNHLKSLGSYKGKYIYLNFCTTQNYACLKELEQLKRIHEKYGKYITVVSISLDETIGTMQAFLKKKGYQWDFLHYGNQPDIIREFDIRIFPTYYLIGKDGKLVWSPAPSPSENFDSKLFEELRAKGIL